MAPSYGAMANASSSINMANSGFGESLINSLCHPVPSDGPLRPLPTKTWLWLETRGVPKRIKVIELQPSI